MRYLALALASGVPALVYEVVWTREVASLTGGEVEAIAIVLAAFFGGLAIGSRWLGERVDRAKSPLRAYALFEATAAVLALGALAGLRALAASDGITWPRPLLLLVTGAPVLVAAVPLGGVLPALLRAAETDAGQAARTGGRIVGANTLGAVAGVAAALFALPVLGMRTTLVLAAVLGGVIACVAAILARSIEEEPAGRDAGSESLPVLPLFLAAVAGVATLAYEVLITRMAAIQVGSSLVAWTLTLGLFLLGLALGNVSSARRAADSPEPARDLAWIEAAAALAIGLGAGILAPGAAARPPSGSALVLLLASVLPPALLMGAAFPFFVRLAAGRLESLGRALGTVSAANTAGGVLGSLLAPFLMLPLLGLVGGALACAGINTLVATALLARVGDTRGIRWRPAAAVPAAGLLVISLLAMRPPVAPEGMQLIFVTEGRQATTAVLRNAARRDLIVNGEAQASTAGTARGTEELLAILPWLLHPSAERFLEVGLGAGITLGMATALPLQQIDCVELAESVLAATPFFQPENRGVGRGDDARVRIEHGDGRVFLAQHPNSYDIVVANTVHPESVGATFLYSREYFERISASLRPGGIAAQWLPLERIGRTALIAILRTFFTTFPYASLYWGDDNLIAIGSTSEIRMSHSGFVHLPEPAHRALGRLHIRTLSELSRRRLGDAPTLLAVLGEGPLLQNDRPLLEALRFEQAEETPIAAQFELLAEIAEAGGSDEMVLWLESRAARARGQIERADRREALAEAAGLALARRGRISRETQTDLLVVDTGQLDEAIGMLSELLEREPDASAARFGLAVAQYRDGRIEAAHASVSQLLEIEPAHARGWNLMGILRQQLGSRSEARAAFEAALAADPFLPEALVNAGLEAVRNRDPKHAAGFLRRLRALAISGSSQESRALEEALAKSP
ncbi:MAG: fused MFS/spermidine synthase [Myxococcota bacterium]|nr:fused MFS/spermidine synthase [Myxococcota bacterium]